MTQEEVLEDAYCEIYDLSDGQCFNDEEKIKAILKDVYEKGKLEGIEIASKNECIRRAKERAKEIFEKNERERYLQYCRYERIPTTDDYNEEADRW